MTIRWLITLFCVFLASCNSIEEDKNDKPILKDSTINSKDRVINEIDTTYYRPVKNQFYQTSLGDIYEQKRESGEDSLGWYDHYYLDSTMVVGDYTNRKPLKDFLDLPSYAEDTISDFSKDKNHVYYTRAQSDGIVRFLVDEANPKTFIGIKGHWGKDNRHVFYESGIVNKADPKSFRVYPNTNDTAKDKNHIYCNGEIIK